MAAMKTPSEILSDCQGEFAWGPNGRNCVTTVLALAKEYHPDVDMDGSEWLDMSEPKSWRHAIKKHGSLMEAWRGPLLKAGLIETVPPEQPGDLLVFDSRLSLADGSTWDARKGREVIAFCDDGYRWLYWGTAGLMTMHSDQPPVSIFRFPALIR